MKLVEKKDHLRFLESNLEQVLFDVQKKVVNPDALTHLKGGLGARHYILRHCCEYLERTCFSRTNNPLSTDIATEAALHLNGYYLNLRGALDNLAWLLQLQLDILPGITEASGKERMQIYLFSNKFIKELKDKSPSHASPISSMKQWGLDLAKLRDPAAHRVPLYVPPGVMTSQEQVDEFRRLDELSGASEEERGGKRRIEIMHEAQRVASFEPVFCVTSPDGIKVYSIPKQVLSDYRRYLHLTRKILQAF